MKIGMTQVGWLMPEGAPVSVLGMAETIEAEIDTDHCKPVYVIDRAIELSRAA